MSTTPAPREPAGRDRRGTGRPVGGRPAAGSPARRYAGRESSGRPTPGREAAARRPGGGRAAVIAGTLGGALGGMLGTGGGGRRPVPGRMPFAILVLALLSGGLITLLMLNTALDQGSFTLTRLQKETSGYTDQQQTLQQQLDAESAPDALARRARALGMVPGGDPAFLAPDGKVLGPASVVTTPPAAPRPSPSPTAGPSPSAASSGSAGASAKPSGSASGSGSAGARASGGASASPGAAGSASAPAGAGIATPSLGVAGAR